MKQIILFFLVLLLSSCIPKPTQQKQLFDCQQPEGIEYTCYSDEECFEYFKGYSAIVKHRFHIPQWYPEKTQTIHINVFADHLSVYLIGKITATRQSDNRIFQVVQTETYDLECNLLEEGYKEGYRK